MEIIFAISYGIFFVTLFPMIALFDYLNEKSGNYDRAFKRNLQKKLLKKKLKNNPKNKPL